MSYIPIEQPTIIYDGNVKQNAVSDGTTHNLLIKILLQLMQGNKNSSGSAGVEEETERCLDLT